MHALSTDMEIAVRVNGTEIGTVKSAGTSGLNLLEVPKVPIHADFIRLYFPNRCPSVSYDPPSIRWTSGD